MSADTERLRGMLAEAWRTYREGRCEHCLRPIASDDDWERIPEGEGEHLCWDYPTCCESQADPAAHIADALLPVVAREVAAARGEALREAAEAMPGIERHLFRDWLRNRADAEADCGTCPYSGCRCETNVRNEEGL